MILIDSRAGNTTNRDHCRELLAYVHRIGCKAELATLEYGDVAFEGNGPDGKMMIGIERKSLRDMINCIHDARYSAHQRPGMLAMYQKDILILEGVWRPDIENGYLLECIAQMTWRPVMRVRYQELFRYMLTVQFSGTTVVYARNLEHTAYNVCEMYHYFQKPWANHTSLLEKQKLNIPELRGRPSLVRRWASELDGIGVKLSMEAEKVFDTPIALAQADEVHWMKVDGVTPKVARALVRAIRGW